ncbi:hypothetical protein SNE40_004270 [Patella caerulea]|uniref:RING-type domain-containing protein n=2 Tax=Patella caerulea TaxID=87958 RepID=A0AAN8Q137_PATCE
MATEDRDTVIEKELDEIKSRASSVNGLKLIACVPMLVSASITKNEYKQLTANIQFPANYPHQPFLVQMKSKHLEQKFTDKLEKICEDEAKKWIGGRQVLVILKFIRTFLEENSLCVCSEEIVYIKRELIGESDEIKLKQKASQIVIKVRQKNYFMNVNISVLDLYPKHQIQTELIDTNLPDLLRINFMAQAKELARQCVTPPLLKNSKSAAVFEHKPSLKVVCNYLIRDCVKRYPLENCPLCKKHVLAEDPENQLKGRKNQIERVYCGHLFHNGCLDTYMKTPPFIGGKKCPSCDKRIYHEKWKVSAEVMENRWAHKQAKQRELEEVVDFLKD